MIVDGSFTLKVESEQDILLLAELIQRRKGRAVKLTERGKTAPSLVRDYTNEPLDNFPQGQPLVNLTEGPRVTDSHRKMLDLLKANYSNQSFHVADAAKLIWKQMKLKRTSVGNALHSGVKSGELRQLKHGIYTFQQPVGKEGNLPTLSIHPNPDFLLDLMADRPDSLLEVCRIAKALSNELPLVINNSGIYCKLTDGHSQIMLDMSLAKSLFTAYQVKKPVELKVDASAIYNRLERLTDLHLSLKQEGTPLLIGNYELNVQYRDFDIKVVPPNSDIKPKSELLITRMELEKILSDNAVNCQHIDIIAEQDQLVFESHGEQGDYNCIPIKNEYRCIEPSRSRLYYADTLLKCIKAARCEKVKLGIGSFLHVEFLMDPAIKISLYLATKKELEATPGASQNAM